MKKLVINGLYIYSLKEKKHIILNSKMALISLPHVRKMVINVVNL